VILPLGILEAVGGEDVFLDHRYAVQIFGEPDESFEVGERNMIHGYAREIRQRPYGQRRTAQGECGIDLVLPWTGMLTYMSCGKEMM